MALITQAGVPISRPDWWETDAARALHRLIFPSRSVLTAGDVALTTGLRTSAAIERDDG